MATARRAKARRDTTMTSMAKGGDGDDRRQWRRPKTTTMATARRDTTMTTMATGDNGNDVDGDGAMDSEVDSATGDDGSRMVRMTGKGQQTYVESDGSYFVAKQGYV